jgi:hypothetical protein
MKCNLLFGSIGLVAVLSLAGCAIQAQDPTEDLGSTEQELGTCKAARALQVSAGVTMFDTTNAAAVTAWAKNWHFPIQIDDTIPKNGISGWLYLRYGNGVVNSVWVDDVNKGVNVLKPPDNVHYHNLYLVNGQWRAQEGGGGSVPSYIRIDYTGRQR